MSGWLGVWEKGLTIHGHKWTFGRHGHALKLDCGNDCTPAFTADHQIVHLQWVNYVYKLYLKSVKKNAVKTNIQFWKWKMF